MQNSNLRKAAVLALVLVILGIGSWEIYLRTHGVGIAYDDGESLWADKRAQVYEPADKATVFIGSSRNKYDLDIATWQALTGDHAIQLAIVGSSPLPVFQDLANDKDFKGKLVVDVTEGLFFSSSDNNNRNPRKYVAYYYKRTPAQRFSFQVNHLLESQLVFLDKNNFALDAMLEKAMIPDRPGVLTMPLFPMEFGRVSFERQNMMTKQFEADTNLQNRVKSMWSFYAKLGRRGPPPTPTQVDSIFHLVKTGVDKIKARGGQVIFVRTPSSGPYLQGENMGFPKVKIWDRLLVVTGCPGIHFSDYPAIDHFQCPEFSHLKRSDAIIFTKNLVDILQHEKGWSFPHQPAVQ